MNCKQGDLAIIVRSRAGNEGRIVEVVAPLGPNPHHDGRDWFGGEYRSLFCWLVRSQGAPLISFGGIANTHGPVPDSWLRPIRPDSEPTSFESHRELESA